MLSNHAKQRMQQRAIPPLLVDLLYRYGKEHRQYGSTVLCFDKKSKKHVRKALDDLIKRFDKLSDVYLVEADDAAITVTVGHRLRRFKNK
jgi:hypothetical protein